MSETIPHFGEILAILTAITWAMAVILFKKSGEKIHPIFFKSLNYLGAGMHAIVNCLYAPSIIGLSVLWLGESMTALQIVGAAMIVSAVLAATTKKGQGNLSRHNLFWGIFWGVIATGTAAVGIVMIKTLLERSPLLWVTEIRLIGGIIILLLVLMLNPNRRKLILSLKSGGHRGYMISSSFIGAYLAMMLWLAGMKYTTASIASALNQTANIFIFAFAALLLREPINLQRVIGILLGVAGALLVTFG